MPDCPACLNYTYLVQFSARKKLIFAAPFLTSEMTILPQVTRLDMANSIDYVGMHRIQIH